MGGLHSSRDVVVVVMVSFSCPGGVILGCPLGLSSEFLLDRPFPLMLAGGMVATTGSFPFTAVNLEVGDDSAFSDTSCPPAVAMTEIKA